MKDTRNGVQRQIRLHPASLTISSLLTGIHLMSIEVKNAAVIAE
jgi:hypothetical protein